MTAQVSLLEYNSIRHMLRETYIQDNIQTVNSISRWHANKRTQVVNGDAWIRSCNKGESSFPRRF